MKVRGRLLAVLALFLACDGERDAPEVVDRPPPQVNGPGPGATTGAGGAGSGGAPSNGGAPGNGGAVSSGGGGEGPLSFLACGCALETLNAANADCDVCVQLAQDGADDPCFVLYDLCLQNLECLDADQALRQTCGQNRTIECAEAALAGTSNEAAGLLIEYFECICSACPGCAPTAEGGAGQGGAGGAGGAGGGVIEETCVIVP